MYKEGRASFSEKKKLTFRPAGVMNVLAGREAAQKAQTVQAGKAAAGTGGTP